LEEWLLSLGCGCGREAYHWTAPSTEVEENRTGDNCGRITSQRV